MGVAGGLLRHPPATPTREPDGPCENFLYVLDPPAHRSQPAPICYYSTVIDHAHDVRTTRL